MRALPHRLGVTGVVRGAERGGGRPMPAVGGEHNVGARLVEALRPIAPHVSTTVIKASGHFVPGERPEDFAQELIDFLA
jgi:pimeloyl-ACP methyl ester carboxylesterase